MDTLTRLLKNCHTIYYMHSYKKEDYVRIYCVDAFGMREVTHEVAKKLNYKQNGMYIIGPKVNQAKTITDRLNV